MMKRAAILTAAFLVAASGAMAQDATKPAEKPGAKAAQPKAKAGATLKVGDKAPAITVAKWVKGEPVTGFEKGRTYVVEFWATWCGPCKKSIPHLTELQKEHKNVRFVGVSVWESDQAKVEPFVTDWGKKMDYTVAMDEVPTLPEGTKAGTRDAQKFYIENGTMSKTWMKASGQGGIPSAFVIDGTGTVQWIGHPMWLDLVIDPVEKGKAEEGRQAAEKAEKTYGEIFSERDPAARLEKFRAFEKQYPATAAGMVDDKFQILAEAHDPAAAELGRTLVDKAIKDKDRGLLTSLLNSLDGKEALSALDAYEKANGDLKLPDMMKYQLFLKAGDQRATETGKKLMEKAAADGDQQTLNQIAWYIVDPKGKVEHKDLDLAMAAATKAAEITKNEDAAILDTLAWVHFTKGDTAKAVELEKKALELAPDQLKSDLEESMKTFEAGKK